MKEKISIENTHLNPVDRASCIAYGPAQDPFRQPNWGRLGLASDCEIDAGAARWGWASASSAPLQRH